MPLVITDGTPEEQIYEPPLAQVGQASQGEISEAFVQALSSAIMNAVAQLPAPVVNIPKPEIKINSPVYVQPPEIKIPATTVNVPEGKAPIVNIEPATVTLQTNRPNEWEFEVTKRNDFGQIVTMRAKAIFK